MEGPLFSIIVVSLNPGNKLVETMKSIQGQTSRDFEVVVKDGGSKDGSVGLLRDFLEEGSGEFAARVRIFQEPDKSIYEGMNQGAEKALGQYFYFLNCGDFFYNEAVLDNMGQEIVTARKAGSRALIYYGDIFDSLRKERVASNPRLDGFACYRHVPCHQACFYHKSLFEKRGYEVKYRVRADYEHFLWSFYKMDARPEYLQVIVARYEGGGFSETEENKRRSRAEHKEITEIYMSRGELSRYRMIMTLTLAPLRTQMSESPALSGFYNKCRKILYSKRPD